MLHSGWKLLRRPRVDYLFVRTRPPQFLRPYHLSLHLQLPGRAAVHWTELPGVLSGRLDLRPEHGDLFAIRRLHTTQRRKRGLTEHRE